MSHWDARLLRPGSYVIRCDGREVASLHLAEVPIESVVAPAVAGLIGRLVDEYRAEQQRHDVEPDWAELGWDERATHDRFFREAREVARSLPGPVQAYLRRRWRECRFCVPLSFDDMVEWDRIVRSAPAVVAQDAAAEAGQVAS